MRVKKLNESVDTVTRYKVEYYAGDNDERLETYIYANSKEEVRKQLVAKTRSEGIDHVVITAMIPEEVPASYRDYDLKETMQTSGNNESKHITEARRKASDPKQIEKAEKAMFDSLMNGAYNTEWMISDAKMIYGLSYDEAVKAFKNAHNKFMLQKYNFDTTDEAEKYIDDMNHLFYMTGKGHHCVFDYINKLFYTVYPKPSKPIQWNRPEDDEPDPKWGR